MTDEEKIVLEEGEYEKLTPKQKEQYIKSLKGHKSLAIDKLNEILKELSIRGENTELDLNIQDDKRTIKKVNRPGNVINLPQTEKGSKYPQIFDRTGIPEKKS